MDLHLRKGNPFGPALRVQVRAEAEGEGLVEARVLVKQRIPFVQPLTPGDFLGAERETLALLAPRGTRHQLYYLARNAIWHGIKALGLKEGDEVLVPAYCHGVELDVLLARGLRL